MNLVKYLLVLLCVVTKVKSKVVSNCECGAADSSLSTRIVQGTSVQPHAYPWVIGIMKQPTKVLCGGSIISSKHILTAAHCTEYDDPLTYTIAVGMHDLKKPYSKHTVKGAKPHPKFIGKPDYDIYDIAIIEVNEKIVFDPAKVVTVCLPFDEMYLTGKKAIIVGWGRKSDGGPSSDILMEGKVVVLTDRECKKSQIGELYDPKSMMCALNLKQDACQGDSGGSMFIETSLNHFEQVGVTSFGVGCAEKVPGVYARTDVALEWIAETVRSADICHDPNMENPKYRNRFRKLLFTD